MAFFFSITETNCCPIKITWSSWLSSFWEKKGKSAPKIVQCVLDLSLFLCLDFPEGYKEKKKYWCWGGTAQLEGHFFGPCRGLSFGTKPDLEPSMNLIFWEWSCCSTDKNEVKQRKSPHQIFVHEVPSWRVCREKNIEITSALLTWVILTTNP